jgi:dihydrofolate synthase/folylpolyglutamate synthase
MGQAFDLVCQGTGFENIQTGLIGRHQAENAALALAAGLKLGIPEQKIREGIRKTRWPGRMEVIRQHPLVLIDGAHNVEGAKALREGLKQFYPGRKVLLVFGMLRDKEVERVAGIMAPYASRVVTVPPASPRAMGPEELRDIVAEYNSNVLCAGSVKQAVDEFVSAAADEMVVFTGSLYMIGEVRRLLPPEIL